MLMIYLLRAAAALLITCSSIAMSAGLPSEILRQLPVGHKVISSAVSTPRPARTYYFVALARRNEAVPTRASGRSPARPLLIFEGGKTGHYALVARNDEVILRADEGGINGCDPFEGHVIATKGAYVTVEQGVACGAHWTDYVTFRFDPGSNDYVFDNWRTQSWSLNSRTGGQALVSDGKKVIRARGRRVPFATWRRPEG